MKTQKELKEIFTHYFEVDLDNCTMTTQDWIDELAQALSDKDYLKKFLREYAEYLDEINA